MTAHFAEVFVDMFYRRNWPQNSSLGSLTDISIPQAYAVQERVARHRLARGEQIAGYKVGCTSDAIRRQFGLQEAICGHLFRPHIHDDGVTLRRSHFENCAIEPELVVHTHRELCGLNLCDEELRAAIQWVSAGIELHHYCFRHQPPTSQELICSGGIHAGLIIGKSRVPADACSLRDEKFSVYKDNRLVASADATEIMGGPLNSLRWLVNFLTRRGQSLPSGSLIIPGSPVELITIDSPTTLRVTIENAGSVTATFE